MEDDDFISKTQRKRRMTELQDVGKALVALPEEQLRRMDLPEALREAVLECKRFTRHEAVRRQMQYIGRLMRDVDAAPIVEQLSALHAPSQRQTALFHVAEKWRADMIAGDEAVDRFLAQFPAADARGIRALVQAARAERAGSGPPRRYRELFHAVNTLVQEKAKAP